MKLEKPNLSRVYVTVSDPATGRSSHITMYETTREEVVAALKRLAQQPTPPTRKREVQTA